LVLRQWWLVWSGRTIWVLIQVICVDNFFTGSKDNIAQLIGKPNFELIRHDITERLVLEVDQIFHLACPASPVHYK
jgi:UDP-glucuronate decarboxylase